MNYDYFLFPYDESSASRSTFLVRDNFVLNKGFWILKNVPHDFNQYALWSLYILYIKLGFTSIIPHVEVSRITDEGSVPEMRIWSILLIKSD